VVVIWRRKTKQLKQDLLLSWTRMRTLTVRRKRRFLDSNVWPPPTILHLAQGLCKDVVIIVVFICNHPWHPSAPILTTLWHGLDVNWNLPFEKWWKIFFIVVVVFAFVWAFWIWFVKAFLFCLFFFFLVIVLIPALLSSFVILLLLLGREGWQLFTDTKEKEAKTLDWMYYPILFSQKSLRLTKHRSCKIGEDGQLR